MGYIIFGLILFIVITLSSIKYKRYISFQNRIILGFSLVMIAGLIALYNMLQEHENENLNMLKNAFMREKSVKCTYQGDIIDVSSKDFNLSKGTMSFQGKTNAPFSHAIIPLKDCVLENEKE